MLVRPTDETIKTLLKGAKYFRIPRFQREYSWDRVNIEDFWNDAVTSPDSDYFIGSFVVYQDANNDDVLYLVDGQQRLTTVTIILAALRDTMDENSLQDLAHGIQGLIEKENINAEKAYVLSPQTSYPYFQDVIQRHGKPNLQHKLQSEEEALKSAYEYFRGQVHGVVKAINDDPSIGAKKKAEAIKTKLTSIREAVLRLRVIVVTLTNEDDAYLVFETLNTRGKDLGVSDLIKNHLTRVLKPKNAGLDEAKEQWHRVRRRVEGLGRRADFDAFLHYSWLSRRSYLPRAKLFKTVKEDIDKPKEMQSFLKELEEDAKVYATVLRPESHKWNSGYRRIQASLTALGRYGVRQPLPFLMALVRAVEKKELTKKQTEKMLVSLEHFHAAFTGVTSKRTGGGTAAMYAAAARDIVSAKDASQRTKALESFREKLQERLPSKADFEAAAEGLCFLDDETRDKQVIRYLLVRLDQHLRPKHDARPDYATMSIEHILPQSAIGNGTSGEVVGSLGNLILVPEKLNAEKLADKKFKEKRKLMRKHNVPMDEVLSKATVWNAKQVEKRRGEVVRLLYDEVLKV